MLVITALVCVRAWLVWRSVPSLRVPTQALRLIRMAPYALLAGLVALTPAIVAMAVRVSEGRYAAPRVFWRTSTPGVDLLAFLLPNPNHPLAPRSMSRWLSTLDGGFVENVASIPRVLLAVIAMAVVTSRSVLSRYWFGLSLVAAGLAIGSFVCIAGVNTYVPGPWSLLRYVPVIGGYLSRVSARRVEQNMRRPVLRALILLSKGQLVPAHLADLATRVAPDFVLAARLGHVVVDRARAEPELPAFATRVLNLEKIGEDDTRTLYRARAGAALAFAQADPA